MAMPQYENMNKKQRWFLWLGLCLLFAAIIRIWGSTANLQSSSLRYQDTASDKAVVSELTSAAEYVQVFPCPVSALEKIGLLFANYSDRDKAGTVTVTVLADGVLVGQKTMDASQIPDNDYQYIQLESAPKLGAAIEVHVSSDSEAGRAVTLWCEENSFLKNAGAHLTVGGMDQNVQLVMNMIYTAPLQSPIIWKVLFLVGIALFCLGVPQHCDRLLKHRRVFLVCCCAGLVAAGTGILYSILRGRRLMLAAVFPSIVQCCMCIALLAVLYLLAVKKASLEKSVAALVLLIGIFYCFVMSPFAIPDEMHHYNRGYETSNYLLLNWEDPNMGREADFQYYGMQAHMNVNSAYMRLISEIDKPAAEGGLVGFSQARVPGYLLAYAPQGLAIALARLTNQNFIRMFYLGRLFNLLLYTMLVYLAVKRAPRFKLVLAMVALLPMNIHQAASYSSDAFTNGMAYLVIASILKGIYGQGPLSKKDYLWILVPSLLLAPSKAIYALVTLLMVLIPRERFRSEKHRWYSMGILLLSCFAFTFLVNLPWLMLRIFTSVTAQTMQGSIPYSPAFVLAHPVETLRIFIRTLEEMGAFYTLSSIGSGLAGLNLAISHWTVNGFVLLLLLSGLKRRDEAVGITVWQRTVMVGIFCAVLVMAMFSQLFSWTAAGNAIIEGVQGRYLLPALPLAVMAINNNWITLQKNPEKLCILCTAFLHLSVIIQVLEYTMIH